MRTLLLLFACTLLACASESTDIAAESESENETDDAIVGGSISKSDHAVIALEIGESSLCSGALIAPDLVLTARHCVARTPSYIDCDGGDTVGRAYDPRSIVAVVDGEPRARGVEVRVPPGSQLCGADVALLVLDRAITGIRPLRVRRKASEGDLVRVVGYGRTSTRGRAGTRRFRDDVEILGASPTELVVGEATCRGDSGGPAIDTRGAIVGVLSRGSSQCVGAGARNVFTRPAVIARAIAEAGARVEE